MSDPKRTPMAFGWLESLIILAVAALAFQAFPSIVTLLNPRNWSSGVWFAINLLAIIILFGVRFVPEFYADWKQRSRDILRQRRPSPSRRKTQSVDAD